MFRKIMIAARGEIAMRIQRCCSEMGMETVLIYSKEDADEMPVQFIRAMDFLLKMRNLLKTVKRRESGLSVRLRRSSG